MIKTGDEVYNSDEESLAAKTVLVCDDEATAREVIIDYLVSHGVNCVEATNGKEAIIVLSKNPVNLALLDVRMPEMNGLQLLSRIKSVNKNFPVILMTGFELTEREKAVLPHKPEAFITKPFAMSSLLRLVRKYIN